MTIASKLQKGKMLAELTTFGIGGAARFFIEACTAEEMKEALRYGADHGLRLMILGKGSNTLFDDKGFAGLVIHNRIDFMEELSPGCFRVGAGFSFSRLGTFTARKNWSGLEFASGIPGSVGGAVYMNAGANGRETCDALESVEFMDGLGAIHLLKKADLTFTYRSSPFQNMQGAIVAATFRLQESSLARAEQLKIIEYRTKTQPYGDKSAGCIFRNPLPEQAGALIDRLGLKGLRKGGVAVSERHANFIINTAKGTASDVLMLIEEIKRNVKSAAGIELESEVRYIPYEETTNDQFSR